jgi:hypothetical protein
MVTMRMYVAAVGGGNVQLWSLQVPILDSSTGAELRTRTITAMTDCQMAFIEKEVSERWPFCLQTPLPAGYTLCA